MNRVVRWWTAPIPLARVAVFRTVVYLFLLYDIFVLVNDVVPHGYAAELYRPLFIGRVLPLPEPSPPLVYTLQVVLVAGALVAATGRLPRLAGWVVAVCYLEWLIIGMSFGKVDHDHLALLVAMWVLPTVGRARFGDLTPSEAGGWAFRCVQVATIATYVGSAFAKWSRNGAPFAWGGSAVFTWAIIRRGTEFIDWILEYPWLLRISQWMLLIAEFLSPVVLFLRGKALLLAAGFFLSFHLVTYFSLGIHFLPTVICWLAFFPLEKLIPPVRRRTPAPTPAPAPEPEPDPAR
ncbi:MAG TPA: hypothetical protein VFH23_11220 [Jiangellaceae bacterium]|nr:hypothetical protein [Jiangellaceae bacterium]